MNRVQLKDWLRLRRMRLCLTLQEVGIKLGVSKVAVCHWEKGKRKPSRDSLKLIYQLYKLPHENMNSFMGIVFDLGE